MKELVNAVWQKVGQCKLTLDLREMKKRRQYSKL